MKFNSILFASALLSTALASSAPSCSAGNPCPKDSPCCDAYGQCGSGVSCLGGCDARFSFAADSCAPQAVCSNGAGTHTFSDVSDIIYYTKYDGDISKNLWSYTGEVLEQNNSAVLTMRKNTVGTVLFSNFFIWYGKVTAVIKTSHLDGVVSDFILMSNVKDEIDYEFVGNNINVAQSNYYFEGLLNYNNEKSIEVSNDTYSNYHEYAIDWQEDSVTWYIDGQAVRTLNKQDTLNSTSGVYEFPQTPARIQLSLWPGGDSSEPEGTVQWAGGPISWDAPDLSDPGYYFVEVQSVTVDCYDPPSNANVTGSKSYIYTNQAGLEGDVEITNDDTKISLGSSSGGSASSGLPLAIVSQSPQTKSQDASLLEISQVSTSTPKSKSTKASATKSIGVISEVASSTATSDSSTDDASPTDSSSDADPTDSADASAANAAVSSGSSTETATTASASASAGAAFQLGAPLAGVAAALMALIL